MTEKIIEILKENETLTGCKEYFLVKRKDYQKVANEIEVAINYTHSCKSDSEQLTKRKRECECSGMSYKVKCGFKCHK